MARSFVRVAARVALGTAMGIAATACALVHPSATTAPPPAVPPTQCRIVKKGNDYYAYVDLVRVVGGGGYAFVEMDESKSHHSLVEIEFSDGTKHVDMANWLNATNISELNSLAEGRMTTVQVKLGKQPTYPSSMTIWPKVYYEEMATHTIKICDSKSLYLCGDLAKP
jgi:hypothetical protein